MVVNLRDEKNCVFAVLECLPYGIKTALCSLEGLAKIEEIRLRDGKPLCVVFEGESRFLPEITVQKEDISYSVRRFCNETVYAHINEINSGYIAGPEGSRIGVAGNFGGENALDFSCLNIRIAHEILGAADRLIKTYKSGGILIAGPPGCGKTTVLRDAVRQLSDGQTGKSYRISVIDTRGEITGNSGNMNTGKNTDIFLFCQKSFGIEAALRTFSPEIICFDEIGTRDELEGVKQSFNAGVDIITTAHAGSISDFKSRDVLKELLKTGAVKTVILMNTRNLHTAQIIESEELKKWLSF